MSFSFYISAPTPPTFAALVEALGEPLLACDDRPETDWPEGYCLHPYLRGKAARGVELTHEEGRFQVRILVCSTVSDYELGVRIACLLAQMTKSAVETEDGDGDLLSPDRIRTQYGRAWIDDMVKRGAELTLFMAEERGTLTMSGARRDNYVGRRFAAELRAAPSPPSAAERLLGAMVRVQNVDEDEFFWANPFVVQTKDGREFSITAWAPDVAYLFPATGYFALTTDGAPMLVPHEAGVEIAGAHWTWLDETNALVSATPPSAWPRLLERASRYATKPF